MKRWMNSTVVLSMLVVCGLSGGTVAMAETPVDQMVLHVNVDAKQGEKVDVSVPLSAIKIVLANLPKDIKQVIDRSEIDIDEILVQFQALEGKDFINIKGPESVRIWITSEEDRKAEPLHFIKVNVKEGKEDGHDIKLNVPVGFVQMASATFAALAENGNIAGPDPEIIKEIENVLKQLKKIQ